MAFLDPGLPERQVAYAVDAFRRHHGRDPQVVGRAPGRVNLIGEHTDYNAGLCLAFALPHSTYVAGALRTDGEVHMTSEQQSTDWRGDLATLAPGRVPGWAAYVAGVCWALRETGLAVPGLDLSVDTTLPIGAGLASSGAMTCATALTVTELTGRPVPEELRVHLRDVCVRAETEMAGAPTGGLDQTVSLLARPGHALLADFSHPRQTTTSPVPLALEELGVVVLVTDTRVRHTHTTGDFRARREDCAAAARALGLHSLLAGRGASLETVAQIPDARQRRRAHHVVAEQQRVLDVVQAIKGGDLATLGRLLSAGHASLRDDFEVSCPELDLGVSTALGAGAAAARMTGGGFGGSFFALVSPDSAPPVAQAIDAAFEAAGFDQPGHLIATPAPRGDVHRVDSP